MYEMEGPRRGFGGIATSDCSDNDLPDRRHPCLELSTSSPADQTLGLVRGADSLNLDAPSLVA